MNIQSIVRTIAAIVPMVVFTATAAVPPVERLLPEDALVVLSAPDYTKLRDAYKQSPQRKFWDDPAMKPFRDKFEKKWNDELIAPLERELGVKFADYGALLQGQITFAITQDGWEGKAGQAPGGVLLIDARDKADLLKKNLADFRKKWTDAGKPIKTEKIRDTEFIVVTLTTNDIPKTIREFFPESRPIEELGKEMDKKTTAGQPLYIGQQDSALLIGVGSAGRPPKSLEKILSRLAGGSAPVLGDVAAFESSRNAVFRDAPVFGWVNIKAFMDVFNRLPDEQPNPDAPNPMPLPDKKKVMAALGFGGLKSLAVGLRPGADGSLMEGQLGVNESSRTGLFKMLAPEQKDAAPPAFVPADAVKYQRMRIDLQKAIASLEKMFGEVSPQFSGMVDFFISNGNEAMRQEEPDFDIRKNLFANLGDDMISYEKAPRGSSLAEIASKPAITLISSPAPEKLAASVKVIFLFISQGGAKPETREFLGRKIYTFKAPGGAEAKGLHYAASGGYLAFSTDVAMLEEYLRASETPPKPLREVAGLADAAQKVGGQGTGWFGYENDSETMRLVMDLLRKSAPAKEGGDDFNPLLQALPFAGPEKKFKDWVDFSLLPPFDKVSKYFGYAVYSCGANADGITFKYYAPVPAALKQ